MKNIIGKPPNTKFSRVRLSDTGTVAYCLVCSKCNVAFFHDDIVLVKGNRTRFAAKYCPLFTKRGLIGRAMECRESLVYVLDKDDFDEHYNVEETLVQRVTK